MSRERISDTTVLLWVWAPALLFGCGWVIYWTCSVGIPELAAWAYAHSAAIAVVVVGGAAFAVLAAMAAQLLVKFDAFMMRFTDRKNAAKALGRLALEEHKARKCKALARSLQLQKLYRAADRDDWRRENRVRIRKLEQPK
jgi:hypothetical protein